jgi:hypothetical protein
MLIEKFLTDVANDLIEMADLTKSEEFTATGKYDDETGEFVIRVKVPKKKVSAEAEAEPEEGKQQVLTEEKTENVETPEKTEKKEKDGFRVLRMTSCYYNGCWMPPSIYWRVFDFGDVLPPTPALYRWFFP